MLVTSGPVVNNENETEKEKEKTEYEQMLWKMQHDARWLKEVALGRRVGWYRFSETIGSGNFSQVKLGVHSLTRDQVAVKIIDKTKLDVKTRKMIAQEIKSMEAVHHPNIIRLLEVMDTYRKLYLVVEYAPGGQLYGLVTSGGALPPGRVRLYMLQVATAVVHMHNLGYVHRDIKAENVFVSSNDIVKLGDFGFSAHLKDDPDAKLNTLCGSPPYAAPELFRDASYAGPPVDVWACGVLLYFLLTASFPFRGDSVGQLKAAILRGQFHTPDSLPAACLHIIGVAAAESDDRTDVGELGGRLCARPLGVSFDLSSLPSTRPEHMLSSSDARFVMWPSDTCETSDLSAVERRARESLLRLGVTSAALLEQLSAGSRAPLVGAYRCVVTRILHEQRVWHSLADPRVLQLHAAARDESSPPPPRTECHCAPTCVVL